MRGIFAPLFVHNLSPPKTTFHKHMGNHVTAKRVLCDVNKKEMGISVARHREKPCANLMSGNPDMR